MNDCDLQLLSTPYFFKASYTCFPIVHRIRQLTEKV